jgi:N-acetylneuraminic acid mutarotase
MVSSGKYLFSLGGFGFVPAAHLKVVERLDETGDWVRIPDLSKERRGITAVCQGPYLFAIGGLCSNEIVMIFERMEYDSSHPSWATLQIATSSYTPRCHNAGISINCNEILIFGGYESNKERKKDAYLFNTTEMKLTKMPDLPKCDYFYQRFPVLVDETVYIVGNMGPLEVHSYNTQSLSWQKYKME